MMSDQPLHVLAQVLLAHRGDIGAAQIHGREQFLVHAIAPLELVLVAEFEDGLGQLLGLLDDRMARHTDDGLQIVVVCLLVFECPHHRGTGMRTHVRAPPHLTDLEVVPRDMDLVAGMQRSVMLDRLAVDFDRGPLGHAIDEQTLGRAMDLRMLRRDLPTAQLDQVAA